MIALIILTVIMVVLKLIGFLNLAWWLVLLPLGLWTVVVIVGIVTTLAGFWIFGRWLTKGRR